MAQSKTSATMVGPKEPSKMAASICTMEYPAPDLSVCRVRDPRSGTAHPAGRVETAETVKPFQAASLAEFAHDLCSPLNALAVTARCLRDEATLDDWNESVDSIISISEHTLRIVRDVLDGARIEAGYDPPRTATCDLQLLVSDVTDVSRPCARAKNLEFVLSQDPACPKFVRTDESRLKRTLINVLDNAVKYTAQGSITLSLHSEESGDPECVWLIFEIRDTGIGIARKDQARIFERFVRASGAAGTRGSGLGLTIASQLVHSMGGALRVESKPGTGSTFYIELPVARAQAADRALPPAAQARSSLPLEALTALPYELRADLRSSLMALDGTRIHKAIERITGHNPALGAILESYASRYAFTGMFEAVSIGL